MIDYLDENTEKTKKKIKCGKTIEIKKQLYFYAHNGKNFDNHFILESKTLKYKTIVHST